MKVSYGLNQVVQEVGQLFVVEGTSGLYSFSEIGQQIEFWQFNQVFEVSGIGAESFYIIKLIVDDIAVALVGEVKANQKSV